MPERRVVDPEVARHRALGGSSRMTLLRVIGSASEPVDAHVLAERVGLHVNTVRWHLAVLIEAGLVVEARAGSGVPGRPRQRYRLAAVADDRGRFGMLAEILVDVLAHDEGDPAGRLEAAGRARGRTLVRPRLGDANALGADEAIGSVVSLLQTLGFQARREHDKGGELIAMRPCPFGDMAVTHSSIVCPVHLGLIRGVFDALRAPVEATGLEPYVEPDLCVARLQATQS